MPQAAGFLNPYLQPLNPFIFPPFPQHQIWVPLQVPTYLTSCPMPVKPTTMMKKKEMRLQMIRMRIEVRRKMDLVRTVNRKKEKGKERELG
ncbi:hypothetical protein SLEP1_g33766 [Rubroshorea leprosula]|uniref:Uncharacterized protein n=1 Tax=Rubroshorea leprosula TaxID=152421 RepID=A0AAV5KHQ5_9ROSI|nr:hypothetical protein SLEP1_g33766 [Rubroshorea leprosula]